MHVYVIVRVRAHTHTRTRARARSLSLHTHTHTRQALSTNPAPVCACVRARASRLACMCVCAPGKSRGRETMSAWECASALRAHQDIVALAKLTHNAQAHNTAHSTRQAYTMATSVWRLLCVYSVCVCVCVCVRCGRCGTGRRPARASGPPCNTAPPSPECGPPASYIHAYIRHAAHVPCMRARNIHAYIRPPASYIHVYI